MIVGMQFINHSPNEWRQLNSLSEVQIPPNSGAWIPFKFKRWRGHNVEVERAILNNGTLIVPSSLVQINEDGVGRLGILNLSEVNQRINLNAVLGEARPVKGENLMRVVKHREQEARKGRIRGDMPAVQAVARARGAQTAIKASEVQCGIKGIEKPVVNLLNNYRNVIKRTDEKLCAADVPAYEIGLTPGSSRVFKRQFPINNYLKDK